MEGSEITGMCRTVKIAGIGMDEHGNSGNDELGLQGYRGYTCHGGTPLIAHN